MGSDGGGGGGGLLSYRTLVHACAGAAGGVVAMTVFFPLDTVRARRQTQGDAGPKGHALKALAAIAAEEGPGSLYRGCVPLLQALCASNFVYFYAFHGLKAARAAKARQATPAQVASAASAGSDLLLASCAGAVNVLLTNPLWVVATRLRLAGQGGRRGGAGDPPYASLAEGLAHEARAGGPRGMWAGTVPSLVLVCNPALQFACYEALKRRLLPEGGRRAPSPMAAFALGALAKAFATVLTYPLQLLQTRMRHGHGHGGAPRGGGAKHGEGLMATLRRVLKEEGVSGLFRGLEAKLLQTVLTAALMFTLYERIAAFVFAVLMAHKRKASLAH